MGKSTFELAMSMLQWLPMWLVDKILLFLETQTITGSKGPLELKNSQGKNPVLDIGGLEKIWVREIRILPEVKRVSGGSTSGLVNGERVEFDAIVLATGYKSNVPYWLQELTSSAIMASQNSLPNDELYAVGFTRRARRRTGDTVRIAQDIARKWKHELKQRGSNNQRRCISTL